MTQQEPTTEIPTATIHTIAKLFMSLKEISSVPISLALGLLLNDIMENLHKLTCYEGSNSKMPEIERAKAIQRINNICTDLQVDLTGQLPKDARITLARILAKYQPQ